MKNPILKYVLVFCNKAVLVVLLLYMGENTVPFPLPCFGSVVVVYGRKYSAFPMI
jgi:hypothetical protein